MTDPGACPQPTGSGVEKYKHILLAEDKLKMASALKTALRRRDVVVDHASNLAIPRPRAINVEVEVKAGVGQHQFPIYNFKM